MKKNIFGLVCVVVVVFVLGLFYTMFQVRETESALVTFFGKPVRTIAEPGLYWRWPDPINKVYKFDSRQQTYEGVMQETATRGGEPIIVTSYVVWRIAEPLKFLESVKDNEGAERQLRDLLSDSQNAVIGRYYFSEFVNTDPEEIKLDEIEEEIRVVVAEQAMGDYGIEVKMVGIKQLGITENVTKDVFARMKAASNVKTELTKAQGVAEATRISTDAERKKNEILAMARAQAKTIRGSGDAEAAKYYKMLDEDPEFALFLRNLEALEKILKKKTTVVLDGESDPVKLLREVPDLEPAKN
jgi:membrane protease subunit HflC